MKRLFLVFTLLFWGGILPAQFHPAPVLPAHSMVLFKELRSRIKVSDLTASDEYQEKLEKINNERFSELQKEVEDSLFLFHPELQNYLDKLMVEIVQAN